MTNRYGILAGAIVSAVSLLANPMTVLGCDTLDVRISGSLPNNAAVLPFGFEESAHSEDRPMLEIPLKQIRAEDAEIILRFTRSWERIWVVDVLSAPRDGVPADKVFHPGVVRVDFDEMGRQELHQQLVLYPVSSKDGASESAVQITFSNLQLTDSGAEVGIVEQVKKTGECIGLGRLDLTNEVNGGRVREVKYYEPGEGLAAMLNDRPAKENGILGENE